jgi:hypothetical protein
MESKSEYYEVVYNTCYGGFSYPKNLIDKIFEMYPPESDVGRTLWKEDSIKFINSEGSGESHNLEELEQNTIQYNKILSYKEFVHGYRFITYNSVHKKYNIDYNSDSRYVTKDNKKYYYLDATRRNHIWRTSPEVIQVLRSDKWLNKKFGFSKLAIAKIPIGYSYDINEYDGKESVECECPTSNIITDLLKIIETGERTNINPLTEQLLSKNKTLQEVLYPKMIDKSDSMSEDEPGEESE